MKKTLLFGFLTAVVSAAFSDIEPRTNQPAPPLPLEVPASGVTTEVNTNLTYVTNAVPHLGTNSPATNKPIELQSRLQPKQPTPQDFIRLGIRAAKRNLDIPEDILVQIAINYYLQENQR